MAGSQWLETFTVFTKFECGNVYFWMWRDKGLQEFDGKKEMLF